MPRPPSDHPTDGELEILQVLWEQGPSSLSQICNRLRSKRPVANTTVATMLKVMLDKDLVTRRPVQRGSLWAAKVTRPAAAQGMVRKLVERVFDGSAQRLIAHLVESGQLQPHELRQLQQLLESAARQKPAGRDSSQSSGSQDDTAPPSKTEKPRSRRRRSS